MGSRSAMSRLFFLCQLFISFACGSPTSGDVTTRVTVGGIIIFVAVVLVSFIVALLVCLEGAGCWPLRYFRRDSVAAIPVSIDNPLSDSGGGVGLAEMDVRALELDPIVFEPLPTLSDLTPRRREGDEQQRNGKYLGAIVPFSSPESHIYAADWFDEPYRNFPRGNIEYIRELGKGWFGQVIEGEARDIVPYAKKMRVIVKVLRGDASDGEQMRFLDESRMYRDGNHANILKLLGHSIETHPFLLLMEFCALGDLKSYLISNVSRAEVLNSRGDVLKMALDVAKGLEWMAASDFTHGDLAARNCQVGSDRILIGDYGLSTQIFKDDYYWSSNIAIPLRWAAPETLHCTINTIQTLRVTKESNVWTFGILLWEIAEFGKLPYFELTDEEVISRVLSEKNYVLGGPTMPSLVMRDEIYSLMTACWTPNISKRPPISSIVQRLQLLIHALEALPPKKGDDFETKWDNQLKKKSVSFSGEPSTPLQPPVNFVISTPATPTTATRPFAKTQIQFERREDPFPSLDLWKPPDPEEEDYKKRIERGEITQKVREKSESVQDLMILTHVEPGDLSDGESLVLLDSSPPHGTLRRAFSETAINSPCKPSSHATKPFNTFLHTPSSNPVNGISSVNKAGINLQLTAPTPSPGIAINVIEATPTPTKRQFPSPVATERISPPKVYAKRRFVFRDDEDESQGIQSARHTSTPIGSPVSEDGYPEVFSSPEQGHERTTEISPISQAPSERSIHSAATGTNSTYSVSIFGPSEDMGLNPYQAVTTRVAIPPSSPELKRNSAEVVPKKLVFEDLQAHSDSREESWLIYTTTEGNQGQLVSLDNQSEKIISPTDSNETLTLLNPFKPDSSKEDKIKVKFQEEIAGANEEVGSLVLHDLETAGEFELIKEDRDEEEDVAMASLASRNAFGGEVGEESLSLSPSEEQEPVPFIPSVWNSALNPSKSAIKSPETGEDLVKETGAGIRKSVSFERKKRRLVYEYPPPTPQTDSDEDMGNALNLSGPLALSLDWELNPDEMEGVVEEDWDVDAGAGEPKSSNRMDLYRISPFASAEDAEPQQNPLGGLGGLRHTRESLKLDLRRRPEVSVSATDNPPKLTTDSGVGSSTNISPFCDN